MNDFVERLGWVLLHSLWQFAFVALLAGVIVRTMRRSLATARYVVLVGAMALMIVAPLATWWMLPSKATDSQASREVSAPGPVMSGDASPGADAVRFAEHPVEYGRDSESGTSAADVGWDSIPTRIGGNTTVGMESQPTNVTPEIAWSERAKAVLRPWLSWIVVAWSIGVLACSLRPLLGWHSLRRLKSVGVSPVSEDVLAAMQRASERLQWRRAVNVMQSALAQVPVVVGYFKPVILLPVSLLTSLPAEQLEAILAHELAHVRRHDFLVNLLQTLIETLFFYHPAVWWLSHQIRVEREHCCDDLVVASFGNRVEYGRALLAIAELRSQRTILVLGAADGSLLSRVRRIVGLVPEQTAVRLSDRWPVALVTLGCLLTLALGTFVSSQAEMEPPFVERDNSAGRGSPDPALTPTAGLPNSDKETNKTNNANGDLQSKPRDSEVAYFQATPSPDDEQRLVEQLRKSLPEDWVVERRFGGYWIDRRRRVFGKHFRETPDVMLHFAKELDVPETPPMEGEVSSESLGPCRFGYCMAAIREDFRNEWPAIRKRIQSVLPAADPVTAKLDDDSPTGIAVAGRLLFEDGQPVVGALVGPMFRKKSPIGGDGRFKLRVAPEWSRFRIHLLDANGWPSPRQWPRNAEHKGEVLDVMLPRTEEPFAICQLRLDRSKLRTVKLLWKGESVAARVNVHTYPSGNWLSVGEAPGNGKPNPGSRKASLNVARTLDVMLRPGETLTIPDVASGDGTLRIVPIKSKRTLLWNLFGDERDERLEHDPAQVGSVEFRITGAVEADAQESPLGFMLSRIMPRSGFGLGSAFYNPTDPYRLEFDPKAESYRVSNLQPGSYHVMLMPEGGTSSPPVMFTITTGQTEKIDLPMPKPARSERQKEAVDSADVSASSSNRAGRGSPDPALTVGLPNSDDSTNPTNNANGDLRSNPAAGSGDPRRAQIATDGPTKTTPLVDIIQRLMKEEKKYNRIEVIVRSHQQPLKVLNNETQEIEIVRRLIRDQDLSYYLEESFCHVQETGATSLIVHEETIQGRWWRQRIESNGPGAAKHSNDSLFVLPKAKHRLGPHTLALGYSLDRPESLSEILTDETPGRRKIIELLGEETIGKERCVKLKELDVSAGGSKFYRLIWLALDKNLLPVRCEGCEVCDNNVERTQPLGFTQVTEWLEVQSGIWFPKCIEVHQAQKTANGSGNLESVRTHTLTVELVTLQPQIKPSLFDKLGKPPSSNSSPNAKARVEQAVPPPVLQTLRKPVLLLPDHWIVQAVGFDNDGKELVTASNQSFITIRRWDVVGGKLISEIKLQADKHGRAVRDGTLMFSGDRRRVVAATDEYVGIWDATTGKLLKQLPFPTKEGIYTCAIDMLDGTPDLSVIVGHQALPGRLTLSFDAHLIVWDGVSGNVLQTVIDKGATDLKALDLSTDGKRLVTTNGGGAKIWETSTGQLLRSIPNDNAGRKHSEPDVSSDATRQVWSVQFSPDGQQLAMGDILGVKLLDATSGKLLQQLEGPYRYSSSGSPGLVFSKDGQWLARLGTQEKVFVNGDKHRYVVPIWSTRTGARLFELHTEANDAAFSDDGQRLAVVFSDMQQALSVWTLSGDAAQVEQTAGPGPHSRQDRVEENGHYVGKTAAEYIDKFQPTWGDAKLGLQYGIALTKPERQVRGRDGVPTYERGERVSLVVFFRNASDKPIKFDTAPDFFGNTPKVLNAKGEPIAFENVPLLGHIPHYHEQLAPGEALGPFYLNFGLGENPRPGQQHWHPYWKSPVVGKYTLTHSISINVNDQKDGDPSKREQIASGTIEFEVADNGNSAKRNPRD